MTRAQIRLWWGLAALALNAAACTHAPRVARPLSGAELGEASFYSPALAGRPTASGVPYDPEALTCAHRTAQFGLRLRVTNLANGRAVVVTVNDRGPFVAGRIIDLSMAAARQMGMIEQGHVRVRVEPAR